MININFFFFSNSEVSGLQVFDQFHKKFLNVEELGKVGDLVLIMGRKIELLLTKDVKLEPTLHRVVGFLLIIFLKMVLFITFSLGYSKKQREI